MTDDSEPPDALGDTPNVGGGNTVDFNRAREERTKAEKGKAKAKAAKAAAAKTEIPDDIRARLHLDQYDRPQPTLLNAILLLRGLPELQGLCFFNVFTARFELDRSPPIFEGGGSELEGPWPKPWNNGHVAWVQAYLQARCRAKFTKEATEQAMSAVAAQNRRHPLADWLRSLTWDGTARLDAMLHVAYGAPRTALMDAISARFLIGAVMRVLEPGCKMDTMLVLEGDQGIRKSSSLMALFGAPYYSDDLPLNWADKDAPMNLLGTWIMEVPEVDKVLESTHSGIAKSFISKSRDKYRAPYARATDTHARQCVFVGTTNQAEWLIDPTGDRRYWPVPCTHADLEYLAANREQLLAEAVVRAQAGEQWYLHDAEEVASAEQQQTRRRVEDPWLNTMTAYIEKIKAPEAVRLSGNINPDCLTNTEALTEGLGMPTKDATLPKAIRMGKVMRKLGWTKHKRPLWPGGPNIQGWWRPGAWMGDDDPDD